MEAIKNSAVNQRIEELKKLKHVFTIQQLFLDLDTAILESEPKIEGTPSGWHLIKDKFLPKYFNHFRGEKDKDGKLVPVNPVLNYHFTVVEPKPATLQLGSVARECLLLKQNGQDIPEPTKEQLNATQLIYIGSTSNTPPVPVPFAWNWIELNEVNQFHGVMAVRREIFLTFLTGILNKTIAMLCIDTNFSTKKADGGPLRLSYSNTPSEKPKLFQRVSPSKQSDGFTILFDISFSHESHAEDSMETTKSNIADAFKQLQSQINTWSNIPDFTQSASDILMSNPPLAGQNSAPSNLGIHLFQGGCASSSSDLSLSGIAEAICNDLINLVEAEGETLGSAADAIKKDIIDQFSSLSVTDLIKKLLAIITDTILQSAENVLVTLLDIFAKLLEGIIDILNAKLDIPILSRLYKELTGGDLSFLDVVSLIAAIPVTIIYKAAANTAPFPQEDSFTRQLISAKNMAEIQSLFIVSRPVRRNALRASATMQDVLAEAQPVLDQEKLKFFGLISGIVSFVSAEVLVITTFIQRKFDASLGGGTPILQQTLATIACVGNIAYVSPNFATIINFATTTAEYAQLNNMITMFSVLTGMMAIPASTANNAGVEQCFALANTCISLMWNYPVIGNIFDNGDKWNTTYKSLICESIGNFASNLGGMLELPIALISDPKIQLVLILVQGGLMFSYGACTSIAGGVYKFASE